MPRQTSLRTAGRVGATREQVPRWRARTGCVRRGRPDGVDGAVDLSKSAEEVGRESGSDPGGVVLAGRAASLAGALSRRSDGLSESELGVGTQDDRVRGRLGEKGWVAKDRTGKAARAGGIFAESAGEVESLDRNPDAGVDLGAMQADARPSLRPGPPPRAQDRRAGPERERAPPPTPGRRRPDLAGAEPDPAQRAASVKVVTSTSSPPPTGASSESAGPSTCCRSSPRRVRSSSE